MSDSPQRSTGYYILNRLEFQFLSQQLKQQLWIWIKIQCLPGRTWVRLCILHVEAEREQTPETWSDTERLVLVFPKFSRYNDKHSLKRNQLPPQDSSQAHKGSHKMKVKWCPVKETWLCLPQHRKGARRTWAFPWFFFFYKYFTIPSLFQKLPENRQT